MNKLADILKTARQRKGVSLRKVEEETKISNSYLCQLEAGKEIKPSPEKLHKLAKFYGISYEMLMEAAGHVVPNFEEFDRASLTKNQQFLLSEQITDEEAEILSKYLKFIRDNKK